MRNLINVLKEHPEYEFVYFNDEGGWLFDKKDNHPHVRHRDDVLALEEGLEDEETVTDSAGLVAENIQLKARVEDLEAEVQRLNLALLDSETIATDVDTDSVEEGKGKKKGKKTE